MARMETFATFCIRRFEALIKIEGEHVTTYKAPIRSKNVRGVGVRENLGVLALLL